MTRLRLSGGADLLLVLAVGASVFLLDDSPGPPPWMKVTAAPLVVLAVAVSRRHPVVAAAVPAGLAATLEPLQDSLMVAQVLLAFLLGRRCSRMRTGLLFFGGVCTARLVLVVLDPGASLSSPLAGALLTIMLPWLAGRYARQHDELVRTGWDLAGRLERERHLTGERVRLVERSRIAGDMHDSLGHELSLVALRAAALQVSPGLDEHARRAAAELRESAAGATERLREIVGVLREDGGTAPVQPSGDTISALVERTAAAGVAVTVEGGLEPLPPMADRAAYRVVQEALTNAAKHAPGAAVVVRLGTDAATGDAVVTVTNQPPPAGPLPGTGTGGHGLLGLRERVRLAGGQLRAHPVGAGFELTARLPRTAVGAAPPDASRKLVLARSKVRRSIIDAIWVPTAAGAALLVLMLGYDLYTARQSVLDAESYRELRIGDQQSSVVSLLPYYQLHGDGERPEGTPPDPPDSDECRYYRTTASAPSPAYRLCFTGGRLSHKDEVSLAQQF